jgi:hypothetical protein
MPRAFRLALATIITAFVMNGFAQPKGLDDGPSGFYLVAIDDCGNWTREPHLVKGMDGEVPATSAPGTSHEERSFSHGDDVVYRYSGLPSSERYKLRVVYLSDSPGRAVRLTAGGVELQGRFEEPEHKAEKHEIDVPASAMQKGVLELRFEKVGAKSVAVSRIELWSTSSRISHNLLLTAKGDSRGGIVGTVTDWLYRPVPRSSIQAHYDPAREDLSGTTDTSGRFSIRAPAPWRSLAPGLISIRASHENFSAAAEIASFEVRPPEIRLTPRPTTVSALETLKVDLGGTWNFTVQPPPKFWEEGAVAPAQVNHIQVPGEWGMQGFSVPPNGAAGYWRTVEVPDEWAGRRIKLECDAVFSLAEVWVNGKKVGQNEGGFTPFEFDVTENVEHGKITTIALLVKQDTMAARLSAMPKYAQHEIGGITRKIYLFAVPELNVFRMQTDTRFDEHYENATLHLILGVENQGRSKVNGVEMRFHLADPNGNPVPLRPSSVSLPVLKAGEDNVQDIEIPVATPLHWENEHPRLYKLVAELGAGGSTMEVVERRIGFRQVEIRMGKLLLNGRAIKLHGVERHETNPVSGRSSNGAMWEKEVRLLREANVNYLFTSHYPVPEELLNLCDELGLLVTEEIPNVWVGGDVKLGAPEGNRDPGYYNTMASIAATTLEKDRSHAAIMFWQACDECTWGRNSASIMTFFKAADPSRPTNYSYEVGTIDFLSSHYPSLDDTLQLPREGDKPHLFDQFASIPNYDFRELVTDPGVRDYYAKAIAPMWEAMYANPAIAGGAIWAWKDDTFYVSPSAHDQNRSDGFFNPALGLWVVGYGDWGLIDGWLRKKPEFWHVKKAYSPIWIQERDPLSMPADRVLHIPAENRYNFTNLNELRIDCVADTLNCAASANLPPRTSGTIEVRLPQSAPDVSDLTLKFFDNGGELVDAYRLTFGNRIDNKAQAPLPRAAPHLETSPKSIVVRGPDFYCTLDPDTNMIVAGPSRSSASIVGGPYLAVTPLEIPLFDYPYIEPDSFTVLQPVPMSWTSSQVETQAQPGAAVIQAKGHYENFDGGYTLRLDDRGSIVLDYRFEYRGSEMEVREIGILFDVAANRDVLSWKRHAPWGFYPAGHIGRPEGSAPAFRHAAEWPEAVFGQAPPWPWELDNTDGGTNDFRSTKYNILWASLTDAGGHGVRVESDGRQNVRAWVEHSRIKLLISDFSNGGGQGVLRFKQYAHEQRSLRKGDVITGSVRLNLGGERQ